MTLLRAFLKECVRTGRDAEGEFLEAEMLKPEFPWGRTGATYYYRCAFSKFRSGELKKRFLRVMFAEPYFSEERGLWRIFREHRDVEEDFSDYLNVNWEFYEDEWGRPDRKLMHDKYCPMGYDTLCRIYERGETERFPVDVYRISKKLCVCVSDKDIRRMLDAFFPVRLKNRVDELTRELLRRGLKSLLKKAIRKSFVTAANIPAVLAEAGRLRCGEEIRVLLMGVPCRKTLAERYGEEDREI